MTEQQNPNASYQQKELLQFLEKELPLLTKSLDAKDKNQLLALLKELKKPCVKLVPKTQNTKNEPAVFYQAEALSLPTPKDRQNNNMVYIGSLNLAALGQLPVSVPEFPQDIPVLHIFRAQDMETLNPKEKGAFALICAPWSPADIRSELAPLPSWSLMEREEFLLAHGFSHYPENFQQAFKSFLSQFNNMSTGEAYLLSQHCNKFPQYFELASFSMSGISYNQQRAQDWHFKHLIEHAQGYKCLAFLDETFLLQSNFLLPNIRHPQQLLLAIHEDNLKQGELNKAFLMAIRN